MPYSVEEIIAQAKKQARGATEDTIFAKMGSMSSDIPFTVSSTMRKDMLAFKANTLSQRGKKIFKRFEKKIKQAVCQDFKYCNKREDVKKAFDKYLPDIVKTLLKRLPKTASKLPGWIIAILNFFKISVESWQGLIVLIVAYLLVKGLDEFCSCKM